MGKICYSEPDATKDWQIAFIVSSFQDGLKSSQVWAKMTWSEINTYFLAITEMVPDIIWAPDFFGPQEIWFSRNLVPEKFGPQEVWSLHKNAI